MALCSRGAVKARSAISRKAAGRKDFGNHAYAPPRMASMIFSGAPSRAQYDHRSSLGNGHIGAVGDREIYRAIFGRTYETAIRFRKTLANANIVADIVVKEQNPHIKGELPD